MAHTIESLIQAWDGYGVVHQYDEPTGTWIFIALHNDSLGQPAGGTRMKQYPTPADGLRDAMRLARGMTYKWAGVGFGFGGGKCVMAVPGPLSGDARTGLLQRYGRLLHSLQGAFGTGPDMGTTPEDMLIIGTETRYVHGVDAAAGVSIDPGPFTAHGVLCAIRACCGSEFGSKDLTGRSVVVQGLGDVGAPLTRMLLESGAAVQVADLDGDRARTVAAETGAAYLDNDSALTTSCDVYAPCAVGGILHNESIDGLQCRVVSGSANNQLESPEHADRLHQRGILYAPDYVANAGGAVGLATIGQGVTDNEDVLAKVDMIEQSLDEILTDAKQRDESPVHAADRIVQRRLAEAAA